MDKQPQERQPQDRQPPQEQQQREQRHQYCNSLTKYERTKIIGMRAEQLARGAQPFVEATIDGMKFDPCEVAERELLAHKLPFYITRNHADGKSDIVKLWEIQEADASEL